MTKELKAIMIRKYESKKDSIASLFSKKVCDSIKGAYEETLVSPALVGMNEMSLAEFDRVSSLIFVIYVNPVADGTFETIFTLDLGGELPLLDTVSVNEFAVTKVQNMLTEDANNNRVLYPNDYMLKTISRYIESNEYDVQCIYKNPDETDEAIHKMAYAN